MRERPLFGTSQKFGTSTKSGTNTKATIALIGNHLPRQCGIATFTTHLADALSDALAARQSETEILAVAVNDTAEGYDYPPRVRFELAQDDPRSYRDAADFLNLSGVDLVCLQHEYGIFGGPAGSHILTLLRELRTPLVTTLHTILREPDPDQRRVLLEIAALSDRLVAMTERGKSFLQEIYGIPADKIDVIPHGVPDLPFVDPNFYKDQFGAEGKTVLLTFGLLSPNKGIEHAIRALPKIVERHPDVLYLVLGATHPHVRRQQGELYRLGLQRLAHELGVAEHVSFVNRFVSERELHEYIAAADIYLTPYLNPAQITSGTLSYAVAAGKAVISTPYWHAEELLADGRGKLVPFADADAIADAALELLDHQAERHAIRKRAYLHSREMIWPRVAERYLHSFRDAIDHRAAAPRRLAGPRTLARHPGDLPQLRLDHLQRLTDDTGLLQHATFAVPNYREGYTTDDNARALLLCVLLARLGSYQGGGEATTRELTGRYLAFLNFALSPEKGRWRNFLGFDRHWLEPVGSDDSHGRALWSLGALVAAGELPGLLPGFRELALQLFEQGLPAALELTSPRAWAFTLLGLDGYLQALPGDSSARQARRTLAERLLASYRRHRRDDWRWFEPILSYGNAHLPHALIISGRALGDDAITAAGLEALRWLCDLQRDPAGHFVPIGSNGFYPDGGRRARFDQQPLEAFATVGACLAAEEISGDPSWRREAQRAFDWFLGGNDLGLPLYDPTTGGCRDGLHPDRPNENQGAESTLAFLLSLALLRLADRPLERTLHHPLHHHAEEARAGDARAADAAATPT